MPLNKSSGSMYPWVDFMHNPLGGECPHKCSYCYVDNPRWGRAPRYCGPLRLIESEIKVKYNKPGTYFICHMNDLFAESVPRQMIDEVIAHCRQWPANTYVFQTKNPERYLEIDNWPDQIILGCTIETNMDIPRKISRAPQPIDRYFGMNALDKRITRFITVEPIMQFDVDAFTLILTDIDPDFINIGADSKGHGLLEPSWDKVERLIANLKKAGIEIRQKSNLERLRK